MIYLEITENNITYSRISKSAAKKIYNDYKELIVVPSNEIHIFNNSSIKPVGTYGLLKNSCDTFDMIDTQCCATFETDYMYYFIEKQC